MLKRGLLAVMTISLVIGFVLLAKRHAMAQSTTTWTSPGAITQLGNMWMTNGVAVSLSAPYVGNGCSGWSNQYVTESSDPANQTMQALIVGAFLSGKQVAFALNGCDSNGAPIIRIVSVSQ
jgi:hypothetical protein